MPKISVLLSEEEEARFVAYCEEKGHKKSTLIALLIKEHLNREGYAAQSNLFGLPNAKRGRKHSMRKMRHANHTRTLKGK